MPDFARVPVRLLTTMIVLVAAVALLFAIGTSAEGQAAGGFSCQSDAGTVSWTDAGSGATPYWIYRSSDGGNTYRWLGRSTTTDLQDPAPRPGVRYQVHYSGIPRANCSISSEPAAPACATGTLEAETATLAGRFEAATDPAAERGEYVHVPRGSGGEWNGARTSFVEFCADITEPGRYRIDARLLTPSNAKRSFYVTVDDGRVNEFVAPVALNRYQTAAVNDAPALDPLDGPNQNRATVDTATWDLQPGEHFIRFYVRRDGVRLDNITLTNVGVVPPDTTTPTPTPTPTGPDTTTPTPTPAPPPAGCSTSIGRNDDRSSSRLALPFPINFGTTQTSVYVNNNGNVTFTGSSSTWTPSRMTATTAARIAPFWADVDTRNSGSGVVTYGTTTYDGRLAFCANWGNVGYYASQADKLNSSRLYLVDRSDVAAGDFDIVFDYEAIAWETGRASGGSNGFGGRSAVAGFTSGAGGPETFFNLPGSAVNGALVDGGPNSLTAGSFNSNEPGIWRFEVRDGVVADVGSLPRIAALALADDEPVPGVLDVKPEQE